MTVSVLCHVGHSEIAYFVEPLWLVMGMWCTEGSAQGSGDEDVDGEKLETARARSTEITLSRGRLCGPVVSRRHVLCIAR